MPSLPGPEPKGKSTAKNILHLCCSTTMLSNVFDPKDIYDPRRIGGQGGGAHKLDLAFILDTTGSQEDYIDSCIACCKDICIVLKQSGLLRKDKGLRLALLAFRDHDDESYLVKDFGGFTDGVDTILSNLKTLDARGGGDGPEASAAALDKALKLKWREDEDCAKVAILITDAPPHGIGEKTDWYENGDPDGIDPLAVAKQMKDQRIALLVVACEPRLSNFYDFAHDFYMALSEITEGTLLPLTNIQMLAPLIVGFSLQEITSNSMLSEFEELVTGSHRKGMSEEKIASGLYNLWRHRGTKIPTLVTRPVYEEPEKAKEYVSIWSKAKDIQSGRDEHKRCETPKIPRVPERYIFTPSRPLSTRIPITLRNTGDTCITYSYSDEGIDKRGTLKGNEKSEEPINLYVNFPYSFTLWSGPDPKQVGRTFTKKEVWDLTSYFS